MTSTHDSSAGQAEPPAPRSRHRPPSLDAHLDASGATRRPRRRGMTTVGVRRRVQTVSQQRPPRLTLDPTDAGRPRGFSSVLSLSSGRRSTISYAPIPMKIIDEAPSGPAGGSTPGDLTDVPIADDWELRGWYFYDFANGPFFYSVLNFLPLYIVYQAGLLPDGCVRYRDCDVCNNCENCLDPGTPVPSMCGDPFIQGCSCSDTVSPLGFPINYRSFALYATTLSVLIQLVTFMLVGGVADYGHLRKKAFILANSVASTACILVIFFGDVRLYWLNAVMLIIANVLFGMCVIFYNAYLPLLVAAHPDVVDAAAKDVTDVELVELMDNTSHKMSARGFGFGFFGQVIMLLINMVIFLVLSDNLGLATRINIMLAGFWAIGFSLITFLRVRSRPGPPLPSGKSYWTFGFVKTWNTLKSYKQLPELFKFFAAYFIYSDGHSTIASAASIFAQEELQMTFTQVLFALLEVSIVAIFGCWLFLKLSQKGVPTKVIVYINLFMLSLLPVYGVVALKSQFEFYILAFIFGLNTGSLQAFTRSLFSEMIPEGHEAEYFSFYEVTDKGTAWLGPLTVGIVNDATGSYRLAFLAIIAFFVIGGAILVFVKVPVAVEQAKAYRMAELEQGKTGGETTVGEAPGVADATVTTGAGAPITAVQRRPPPSLMDAKLRVPAASPSNADAAPTDSEPKPDAGQVEGSPSTSLPETVTVPGGQTRTSQGSVDPVSDPTANPVASSGSSGHLRKSTLGTESISPSGVSLDSQAAEPGVVSVAQAVGDLPDVNV